jgi:hypothetical protein
LGVGNGSGNIQANLTSNDEPSKIIFCPKGYCSASFDYGRIVRLTATPDQVSLFNSWSGDCTTVPCDIEMTGPKTVSASFLRAHNFYNFTQNIVENSLESLIGSALPGDEIRMLAAEQSIQSLVLTKALTLTGGWRAFHQLPADVPTTLNGTLTIKGADSVLKGTTIKGTISIQSGSLKVDRVTVRPLGDSSP